MAESYAVRTTLSDAEWREFQEIPEEGHSHRAWVEAKIAARVAEQYEHDTAMHRAYRPEVVAEVAVHLGSHDDWTELAKWCGGTLSGDQDPSGEWSATLTLPNGERAGEWAWLVLTHSGEFHFRTEVQAPEPRLQPGEEPDRG